jgi:hypothetical protein
MRNAFLTSVISVLALLLIVAVEKMLYITGIFQQFHQFFANTYFIILLLVETVFIFRLLRELKYAHTK